MMQYKIYYRNLTRKHLSAVAKIHCLAFPKSSLTKLGLRAIERYYLSQITEPNQVLLFGAYYEDMLVGFILGGVFHGILNQFIPENKWLLVVRVLFHPWLLMDPFFRDAVKLGVKKLKEKNKHKFSENKIDTKYNVPFVILSIAVSPDFQNLGIGQQLLALSESKAAKLNHKYMTLTVNPENSSAIRFYEKLGWHKKTINQQGYIEMSKPISNT